MLLFAETATSQDSHPLNLTEEDLMSDQRVRIPDELTSAFCRLGNQENHPWERLPWERIANKVLYFDSVSGATIELARIEKGCTFPEHYLGLRRHDRQLRLRQSDRSVRCISVNWQLTRGQQLVEPLGLTPAIDVGSRTFHRVRRRGNGREAHSPQDSGV